MYLRQKEYFKIWSKVKILSHYLGIQDTFFGKFYRRQYAKKICKKIKELSADKPKKKLIVCYDLYSSPPTMGDFLNVIMLARYLCLKGQSVKFFVITSELRDDWKNLNEADKNSLLQFMKEISQIVIPVDHFNYEQISWEQFINFLSKEQSSRVVTNVFENNVLQYRKIIKRRPIYNHAFNIINYLLNTENKYFTESFLLSTQDFKFSEIDIPILNKEFVTWHLRYNTKWGLHRNLTQEQFDQMVRKIKSENPNMNIVIVSDAAGTEHYKKMLPLDCELLLFSKDYGDSFFQDAWLILKSSKYYQYLGGGIAMIPIFSRVDYEIIDKCSNEISWAYPNFTSWAHNSNQKRYFNLLDDNTVV